MIRIEGLTKVFKGETNVRALDNICTQVEKGDIFAVIGMSGAGKSTLLRCIAQLETPDAGSIYIDDADVTKITGTEKLKLRKQVGVIFQGYHLLMQRTVRGNISFPLELDHRSRAVIDRKVDDLLNLVGLSDKANAYPSQLSGGQMQRVAIARALANDPKILLCDEPTSALDSLTTKSILKLLEDINTQLGVTVFIITHEIGVVRAICKRVAVINEGQLVEQGRTEEVFAHPKHLATRLLLGMEDPEKGGDAE
ncbi:MAG TPA: ATP-binding cassette domain-containing protein [Oscillospiraceae bacterium]|nr:ATP-binding cassette domain-containing protein [Oscillospiraceae bacterium]